MTQNGPTKILVVDDRSDNILAMVALLDALTLDIEVITTQSGYEALRLILDHNFAILLVDVQMPGMDGVELAELVRSRRASSHIPIIFVTAGAHNKIHIFKGHESAAVHILFKPIEPKLLADKVKALVGLDKCRPEAYDNT